MRGKVKHGSGNVMVWGFIAWYGVGKLEFVNKTMNGNFYVDILD